MCACMLLGLHTSYILVLVSFVSLVHTIHLSLKLLDKLSHSLISVLEDFSLQ